MLCTYAGDKTAHSRTLISPLHLTFGKVVYCTDAWSSSPGQNIPLWFLCSSPFHAGSKSGPHRAFRWTPAEVLTSSCLHAWMKETTLGLPLGQTRRGGEGEQAQQHKKDPHFYTPNISLKKKYLHPSVLNTDSAVMCGAQSVIHQSCLLKAYQRDHKMSN